MKLKQGKEEIIYLLGRVLEKYELQTGHTVIRNSNRKNYEGVAKALSDISNELPNTADVLQHEAYLPDYNPKNLDYPFRKYDITGNQIKDAYFNQIVSNPRSFLVDACYIYLYGVGRKGFELNPTDDGLLKNETELLQSTEPISQQPLITEATLTTQKRKPAKALWLALSIAIAALAFVSFQLITTRSQWSDLKKDMKLLPYQPTQQEIDSLEGVWLCYTGSPQARSSDPNRYHLVVSNVVDVKYKNGYFVFNRYGASFDHNGYMQFESPWTVSIHSYLKNNSDSIESPRHSLMRLDEKSPFVSVISASWNFDVGSSNNIIGIREVYIKQGRGGNIDEVINTVENASCHCKLIRWRQTDGSVRNFYLRNESLDKLSDTSLRNLLNENSILLRVPQKGVVISDTTASHK